MQGVVLVADEQCLHEFSPPRAGRTFRSKALTLAWCARVCLARSKPCVSCAAVSRRENSANVDSHLSLSPSPRSGGPALARSRLVNGGQVVAPSVEWSADATDTRDGEIGDARRGATRRRSRCRAR